MSLFLLNIKLYIMTHYIHNMRKVGSWQRRGKLITFTGLETKAHQSCMPRHLCLGCIGAISSDSVALFVSHGDKVFWLNIVITLPDRKGSFQVQFFQLSFSYSMSEKCTGERSSQWGNKKHSPVTQHVRHTCDPLTPHQLCNAVQSYSKLQIAQLL